MTERLIDKLRKIEKLAQSGIEGERKNAKTLLEKFLKKYNITLDQIKKGEKQKICFMVSNHIQEILLIQIIGYICGNSRVTYFKQGKRRRFFELTPSQAEDVTDCYKHYKKEWKRQLKDLVFAFIQKNQLGVSSFGERKKETKEEIKRAENISKLMEGIRKSSWIPKERQISLNSK